MSDELLQLLKIIGEQDKALTNLKREVQQTENRLLTEVSDLRRMFIGVIIAAILICITVMSTRGQTVRDSTKLTIAYASAYTQRECKQHRWIDFTVDTVFDTGYARDYNTPVLSIYREPEQYDSDTTIHEVIGEVYCLKCYAIKNKIRTTHYKKGDIK